MAPGMQLRIALIHATPVSIEPIRQALERFWPDAFGCNILDDSLSTDLRENGHLSPEISKRISDLAAYAYDQGPGGILFTCSAFGSAIALVKEKLPIPVLTPNEAMLEQAMQTGERVGLLASFGPMIASMEREWKELAELQGRSPKLQTVICEEAMAALAAGDARGHDQLLADAARGLSGCDVVMLAQFSTARARDQVAVKVGCPVLTSPESAVLKLRRLVLGTPA